jgi:hypothetical protein
MLAPDMAPIVRAKVVIARHLCAPADRLIKVASCDIRSRPFNYWVWFHAWLDMLQNSEADVANIVKHILTGSDIVLNAKQLAAVADAALLGVKEAKKRPYWHLLEDEQRDQAGNFTKIREILDVYRRRECFTIKALLPPDAADPRKLASWAQHGIGQPIVTVPGFQLEYSAFYQELQNNTLPESIPPPPAAPALRSRKTGGRGDIDDDDDDDDDVGAAALDPTPAYSQALATFWSAVAAIDDYAVVGKAALRALAIHFSQTAVEQAFSMLKNLAAQNRLHAGERYLFNLMMLNFNEPYYIAHSETELQTLGLDELVTALRS